MATMMETIWNDIPPTQRVAVGTGIVVVLALAAAAAAWALAPRYETLFRELPATDANDVVAALDRWGVAYTLGEDGEAVLVPTAQVHATRLRLASEGLPGRGTVGFELFDDAGYGMTEFAQRINYQRALQGELERTISALDGVARARVHLTLKRAGLFPSDSEPPKGSVTLDLEPGASLTPAEIGGIRQLIGGAVEGLQVEAVAVLDGGGRSLAGEADIGGDPAERGTQERERAAALERKVAALLAGVFELDRYSVSVDVRLNYDRLREVRDELITGGSDGNGALVRRRQSGPRPDPVKDAAETRGSTITESDYAHGTSHQERIVAPGRVERLTVAILVPRSVDAAMQQRLREVVGAAIGIDLARGDRIEIGALKPERVVVSTADGMAAAATTPAALATAASRPALGGTPAIAAAAGFSLAVLLALLFALGRRQPRLSPTERSAAAAQLRAYLDGPVGEVR